MKISLLLSVLALSAAPSFAKDGSANHNNGRTADGKPDYYQKIYDRTIEGKSLDQYFAAINGGWHKNLSAMRPHLKPDANYIVLHLQQPDDVFDFRSAENFKKGLMSKGLAHMAKNTMGIGHFFLSWRCQVNGAPVEGTVGMTGELDDQFKKSMDNGWGLTTFLGIFQDGHLQTPELLDFEFENYEPLHSLAIEVSPEVCGNAMSFVKTFLFKPNRPFENFGLGASPDKFEGGGCGSFAVTVLQHSGIFNGQQPIAPLFWRTLYGNPRLFGQGMELPSDTVMPTLPATKKTKRKVDKAMMFLTGNWNASSPAAGIPIHFMDPEMALLFVKTTYRSFLDDIYRANGSLGVQLHNGPLYQYRMALQGEIRVDAANQEQWSVISSSQQPINERFDSQAAQVVAHTRAWNRALKANGYRAHPVLIGSGVRANVGVVLDRQ